MTHRRYSASAVLCYDSSMKVPPRLVPHSKETDPLFQEQRHVPRFPLPKEQIKFFLEESLEKVCAIRDLSASGVGISLLEHGEVLLFPLGQEYKAELKLDREAIEIQVVVRRVSAWSVGFEFLGQSPELTKKVQNFLSPMAVGKSLKKVSLDLNPEVASYNLTSWYHGASSTDLYFWNDARGGVERVLLCLGNRFWEWSLEQKIRTGHMEREEGDRVQMRFDNNLEEEIQTMATKVLEHAEVLDYRLVSFLKDQTRK